MCNAACVQRKRSCKCEGEICVSANNQVGARVWVYICVCVIIKQISSTQLLVCVCVIEALLEVLYKKHPKMCVCLYTCKIKGRYEYVCVIVTLPSTASCVYVCVCMYANTAEQLRLHKAVFYC